MAPCHRRLLTLILAFCVGLGAGGFGRGEQRGDMVRPIHHLSLGQRAAAPTPAPGDEAGSGPRTPAPPSTRSASSAAPPISAGGLLLAPSPTCLSLTQQKRGATRGRLRGSRWSSLWVPRLISRWAPGKGGAGVAGWTASALLRVPLCRGHCGEGEGTVPGQPTHGGARIGTRCAAWGLAVRPAPFRKGSTTRDNFEAFAFTNTRGSRRSWS